MNTVYEKGRPIDLSGEALFALVFSSNRERGYVLDSIAFKASATSSFLLF
jgi:hypothetical protein